jgi:hypothetical protein
MYSAGHIGAHMDMGTGMPTLPSQRVELGSIEILPDGESFVIGLVGANQQMHRMEMPAWTVHQLMRVLPRLEAALAQARDDSSAIVSARSA